MTLPKILAFVLPQFHRVPENDAWWGEGFTEWTNVKRAKPIMRGHYQPRVPAGGRYYDLTDPDVQRWQAELARAHGLDGFCYYHYWFGGKRLLERPVNLLIERGEPDFPFCLAWANEPWTRAWDGGDSEILMPQTYGLQEDWETHFLDLLRAFKDPRYIRLDGKPVFLIYRSASIPHCNEMIACWRQMALDAGLPGLHLVAMLTGHPQDTREGVFDAFAEFEPMYTMAHRLHRPYLRKEKLMRNLRKVRMWLRGEREFLRNSHDYRGIWRRIMSRRLPAHRYPGAFADWDNSPRRGNARGIVFRNFDKHTFVKGFEAQYRKAIRSAAPFLFFNAWNEWAEGTYLEPDEGRGLFFLETIRDIVAAARRRSL